MFSTYDDVSYRHFCSREESWPDFFESRAARFDNLALGSEYLTIQRILTQWSYVLTRVDSVRGKNKPRYLISNVYILFQ
jgi:hypothetical protein